MVDDVVGALEELVEQQASLVRRKAELREKKDGYYREKHAALQERMKELDQSALEHRKARHAALRRMAELRGSEEAFKLKRLEYARETWEIERGLQLEKMARQMMEMQPVMEQRHKLEDEQRLRLRRLDAIEDEKVRRRRVNERQLQDSLDRAKHLQDHAGEGRSDPVASALEADESFEHAEEAPSIGRDGGAGDSSLAKIAAEIDIVRRREAHESVRVHEALRRKLNEQRFRLAGATDSVDLKRQQFLRQFLTLCKPIAIFKKVCAKQAGGLKALAREELGPAAFQILTTPAPPEVTSTWMSTAVASKTTKTPKPKPSRTKASKGKRSGSDEPSRSHGDDNNNQDKRGDRNDGSKTPRSSGSPAESPGEASAGGGDDDTNDEQREAREDAGRSAAISAFLRAASAGGRGADHPSMARSGGGGGARVERKRAQAAAPLSTSGKAGVSAASAGKSRASGKGFPGSRRRHHDGDAHGRLSVRQRRGLTSSSTERGKEHGARRGRAGEDEGSGTGSEEQGDEQDDSEEDSGGEREGEGEEEEEEDQSVALDMEGLVADLRAREGEAVSRIEALRSQAKALAEEEQWLATGSLGKGHAWEAVSRLGVDNER
ncbi:hypothetical protein Esi_0007_0016 [Ectocarpus siliculosus]|uniref:Uncharacterized protein n=1 Tax=Ectocarpus siliculosus TaxID=2880 RepID=D8LRY8_ECTSI|nr:hypothetical protein Esi_0007_0016 [Ectocarpus siliculosus]|eukprot:CBN73772.1 hypothetical protein Esi_0007_0016 [Ectocarpus siliculosus]